MHFKRQVLFILYVLAIIYWWPASLCAAQSSPDAKKVNLAIRRTADKLLRISGDSTSRIGAVEKINSLTWRLEIESPFVYDSLPGLLQSSLAMYQIDQGYDVTIRRCENGLIDLGYQKEDFLVDSVVPCGGRASPEGCHYIEVAFFGIEEKQSSWMVRSLILLIGLTGSAGVWYLLRKKSQSQSGIAEAAEDGWIAFGQSKLHPQKQILVSGAKQESLTYREAKLLSLFVAHIGELLEREFIHQQVWADEGLQVSRSVDVFVSRLRKKLAGDNSLSIVAAHGVGYKLEVVDE